MSANKDVLDELDLFNLGSGGLGSWITKDTDAEVLARIGEIDTNPITKVQLNQLLAFGHEAPLSDAFFRYYWLEVPSNHPYEVTKIPFYNEAYKTHEAIQSIAHLKWGLYRIYVDGLLYFGNIRSAYRELRARGSASLQSFFNQKRFNTDLIKKRGPALPLKEIAKDDRYLIAEMACKSYGEIGSPGDLRTALVESFKAFKEKGGDAAKIGELLEGVHSPAKYKDRQAEFKFSADEVLEERVSTVSELEAKYEIVAKKFTSARNAALRNTKLYLSMVGDLDVYVATSMRTRKDFRDMAGSCESIFLDPKLSTLKLRYFDPTLSAAAGHEDKGLIELT